MINLFIDANIFLSFYHYSKEDLERLKDLNTLIYRTENIKLFISSNLYDEINRNRESKIKDALIKFNDNNIKAEIPYLLKNYKETEKFQKLIKDANKIKNELLIKLKKDIKNKALKADYFIEYLLKGSIKEIDKEIIELAKRRFDLGNPPGKRKSYGDAINWEYLLKHVPEKEDVYIVSSDGDYSSPLNEEDIADFLKTEWKNRKKSEVFFYNSLNKFFSDKFPGTKLDNEYIKDMIIKKFENSNSFNAARKNLKELYEINDFSPSQLNKILKASITNDQIYNAHKYSPEIVGDYLEQLIKGHEEQLDFNDYVEFCKKFNIVPKFLMDYKDYEHLI
jgi:hypothetical protein